MAIEVKDDCVEVSGSAAEIVGAEYDEILPTQPSVNEEVVKSKDPSTLSGQSAMTCWISAMKKIYLLDGHHTFVACRRAGVTARITRKKFGFPGGYESWKAVKWENFVPAKNKLKGKE